jgi:hypothetical protein
MNAKQDIVFKRCGCTKQDTGRQLAGHCPRLAEQGHGSWYYAVQVTTVGGRKARYRRGGFVRCPTVPGQASVRMLIRKGKGTVGHLRFMNIAWWHRFSAPTGSAVFYPTVLSVASREDFCVHAGL